MSDGTKGLRAGGVENVDGLLGALRAIENLPKQNPTPTPPPERADLEDLEACAVHAEEADMPVEAECIRAAAAELERLGKQVHSDDMEARSALGWAGEFDLTNTVPPQRSVVELGLALRERNADLARLRAENEELRAVVAEQEGRIDELAGFRPTPAEPEETVGLKLYLYVQDELQGDGKVALGSKIVFDELDCEGPWNLAEGQEGTKSVVPLMIRIPAAEVRALFATREVRGEVVE